MCDSVSPKHCSSRSKLSNTPFSDLLQHREAPRCLRGSSLYLHPPPRQTDRTPTPPSMQTRPTCRVKVWHHHRFFTLWGAPPMMSKPMLARKEKTTPDTKGFAFLRRLPCIAGPALLFFASASVPFLLSTAVSGRCGAFTGVLPPCCCCCSCWGYVTRSITAQQPGSEQWDGWRQREG